MKGAVIENAFYDYSFICSNNKITINNHNPIQMSKHGSAHNDGDYVYLLTSDDLIKTNKKVAGVMQQVPASCVVT